MSVVWPDVAGSGGYALRATWSEALGPAFGSLEYELRIALADSRRWREMLHDAQERVTQLERRAMDAERERRQLEAQVREAEAAVRLAAEIARRNSEEAEVRS